MNGSDKCANCGGDRGIHHYQTEQCPVGGVEAHVDRPQEYKTSTFKQAHEASPFEQYATIGNHPFHPNADNCGITLREYFAAMAMQGLLAQADLVIHTPPGTTHTAILAETSVAYANALIDALNKEKS